MNRRQRKINEKAVENDKDILDSFMTRIQKITFNVEEGETEMQAAQKAVLFKSIAFMQTWNKRFGEGKRANALKNNFPIQVIQFLGLYEEDTNQDAEVRDEAHTPDGGVRCDNPPAKRRRATKKKSEDAP